MSSLAENLKPPYYAAIVEAEPHTTDEEPANEADRLVSLALRQPGFLGLETAHTHDGRPVTVAYWRDLNDVEGWKSEMDAPASERFPMEIKRIADHNDPGVSHIIASTDGEKLAWRYT